jgi:hypothetical protein
MEKKQQDQADQDFASTLYDIAEGAIVDQLNRGLAEVVLACELTNKGGAITLTLTVKPLGNGQAQISGAVKLKTPQPTTMPSIFFAREDGTLTREDPRQLKLRHVEAKPGEIRIVGAVTPKGKE